MKSNRYLAVILVLSGTFFSFIEKSLQNHSQAEQIKLEVLLNGVVINQRQPLSVTTVGHLRIAINDERKFRENPDMPIGIDMTLARSDYAVNPTIEFEDSNELEAFKIEDILKNSQSGDRLVIQLTNSNEEFINVFSID